MQVPAGDRTHLEHPRVLRPGQARGLDVLLGVSLAVGELCVVLDAAAL